MPLLPIANQPAEPSVLRFFHPVLKASALRDKPVRVSVAGKAYALFRDQTGRACAVADRCPHRFAPLSEGRVRPDGRLACPYHGWHFDGGGHGQSPSQPSLQHCNVHALRVEERMGYLWLGERDTDPTSLDAMFAEHAAFDFAGAFEVRMEAALEHVLDIFSDAEHPPWLHTRLAWTEAQVADIAYADQRKPDSSCVQTSGPQRSSFVSRALGIRRTDRFNNHWVTRFDPVRGHYNVFWTSPDGQSRRPLESKAALFMVSESERVTRVVVFVHCRLEGARPRLPYGLLKRLLVVAAKQEILDDTRFIALLKDAPLTSQGMRLGRMDGVILHNRRLLERLYFKRPALPASVREPLTPAQARQEVGRKSAEKAQANA